MANTLFPIFGRQTGAFNTQRPQTFCVFNYAGRGFRLCVVRYIDSFAQII